MTEQEALTMLSKARAQLLLSHPFFATLTMRLTVRSMPDVDTLSTDGVHLNFRPEGLDDFNMDCTKTGWAHEGLHCGLQHHVQMAAANGKDPDLMNRAMDYAVNAILKADGFYLKPEWLYDQRFENMTWQEIYKILERPGQGGKGKGGQPGQPGNQPGKGQPGKSPAAWGAVTAPPPGKVEEQAADWRIAVQQAIQAARSCGSVPAGIEQLVEITKGPRASWFDRLKRFVAETVVADYTWSRPSRRTASLGIYLPSTTKEGTGHIDVAIDCSGSISDRELQEFGSKFDALHEELKPELVRAIYFDAIVQNVKEFGPEDAVTFDVKGRGGTDVRSAFKWIEESGRNPKCLVVLTDLETPFPDTPPSYPVLWVTVNQHTPPFGDCAFMEVN